MTGAIVTKLIAWFTVNVDEESVSQSVRRLLKHPELNTRAKRMGYIIQVSPNGLSVWHAHEKRERRLTWD